MIIVFNYANTYSLARQMKKQKLQQLSPGDVVIQGGFPGHAVLVLDMAVNRRGQRRYLLGQSYMPAQDIHILNNPAHAGLSPWYRLEQARSETPEWSFEPGDLRRF